MPPSSSSSVHRVVSAGGDFSGSEQPALPTRAATVDVVTGMDSAQSVTAGSSTIRRSLTFPVTGAGPASYAAKSVGHFDNRLALLAAISKGNTGQVEEIAAEMADVKEMQSEGELQDWMTQAGRLNSAIGRLPFFAKETARQIVRHLLGESPADMGTAIDLLHVQLNDQAMLLTSLDEFLQPWISGRPVPVSPFPDLTPELGVTRMQFMQMVGRGDYRNADDLLSQLKSEVGDAEWLTEASDFLNQFKPGYPAGLEPFHQTLLAQLKEGKTDEAFDVINQFSAASPRSDFENDEDLHWCRNATRLVHEAVFVAMHRDWMIAQYQNVYVARLLENQLGAADTIMLSLEAYLAQMDSESGPVRSAGALSLHQWMEHGRALSIMFRTGLSSSEKLADKKTAIAVLNGHPLSRDTAYLESRTSMKDQLTAFSDVMAGLGPVIQPFSDLDFFLYAPKPFAWKERAAVAHRLATGELDDAKILLTQLQLSGNHDHETLNWISDCSRFIGGVGQLPPPHLIDANLRISGLARVGNPVSMEEQIKLACAAPATRVDQSQRTDDWMVHVTQSLFFIAIPIMVENIFDMIERGKIDAAVPLITQLVQYQNDFRRPGSLSAEIQEILSALQATGKLRHASHRVPAPVRASKAPLQSHFPERGLYLSVDSDAIVNFKGTSLADGLKFDKTSSTLTTPSGDYVAHVAYVAELGLNRLHADNQWYDNMQPVMYIPKGINRWETLHEMLDSGAAEQRHHPRSLDENLENLARWKELARMGLKDGTRFSPKRALNVLWEDLDIGAGVDSVISLFTLREMPAVRSPGQLINRASRSVRRALTNRTTGTRSEYSEMVRLLEEKTEADMALLAPKNVEACRSLRDMMRIEITYIPVDSTGGRDDVAALEGMARLHQAILSIDPKPKKWKSTKKNWPWQ